MFDEDVGSADDKIGQSIVKLAGKFGSFVENAGVRRWIPHRWNQEGWFALEDESGKSAGELRLLLAWDSMSADKEFTVIDKDAHLHIRKEMIRNTPNHELRPPPAHMLKDHANKVTMPCPLAMCTRMCRSNSVGHEQASVCLAHE